MSKSRARFLAELLGTDGLVKTSKSALAGADSIIDLDTLPSIPNSKLTNSSITINSNDTSLGGSVTLTTANVAENTNLYYTNARADARIAAATTDDLSEGSSNLYYTDARVDARISGGSLGNITTTGYIRGPSSFTIDPAAHGDNSGTVVIAGNLQVDGTTTTINSTTMTVDDKNITLASGSANAAAANGAGFTVDIGSGTNPTITYDGTNDEWDFNKPLNVTGGIEASGPSAFNYGLTSSVTGNTSEYPLDIGSTGATNFVIQRWQTNYGYKSFIIAYGSQHSSQAGNFAIKNNQTGKDIYFQLANSVEPLRLTSTGATFAGTISSGAITSSGTGTFNNRVSFTDGDITSLSTGIKTLNNGGLTLDLDENNEVASTDFRIRLDRSSGASQLVLDASGNLDIEGAITSTGSSSFGDVAIGGAADSNYDLKVYGLARFQGAANFVSTTNPIQVGGLTIVDSSRNLTNIGTISSGAITSSLLVSTIVDPGNPSPSSNELRVSGYGVIGNRGNLYLTNSNASGQIVFGISGAHNANPKLTLTTTGATFAGTISSGNITTTGYLRGPSTFTIDPAAHGDNTGTVVIAGNLQVDGTTTTINSTTLTVDDLNITLASGAANAAAANGAGINIDGASATLIYTSSDDSWAVNKRFKASSDIRLGSDGVRLSTDGNGEFGVGYGQTATNNRFTVYNNTTAAFRILPNGNVGIGTTSPADRLHISGGNILLNNALEIRTKDTGGNLRTVLRANSSNELEYGWSANAPVKFMGGGSYTERMRIHTNGYVGINQSNPSHRLQVSVDANGAFIKRDISSNAANLSEFNSHRSLLLLNRNSGSYLAFGGNGSRTDIQATDLAGTPTAKNIALNPFGGNVGIGTDSPSEKLDVAGTALVENAKLKAIAESNTDTAVDVFVYDTRKDSDGGAWRKRTQNTSWYNETLNTATRGARKEFPCVAVIVALGSSGNNVTIYDGDDPSLPMWMQFTLLNQDQVSISAMNGTVCLGNNYTANSGYGGNGLVLFEFAADRSRHALSNATVPAYDPERLGVISGNQATTTIWPKASAVSARFYQLVNTSVNDVAMTVLPNAPIDADTGLPVPTIAVATNGGLSVIKDDGTVVDITFSSEGKVGRVAFIGDKIRLGGGSQNYIQYAVRMYDIPTSDTSLSAMYINDASALNVYFASSMATTPSFNADMFYNGTTSNKSYAVKNAIGSSTGGLTHLYENFEDATKAMMAYATSDYNTGWMVGDIKLATLSDTDTTNAASTDLLGGIGNFTDANAWSVPSGWSLSSNVATGSAVTAYLLPASNGILTTGKQYAVTVTQSSYTSGTVYMYMGTGAPNGTYYSNLPSTTGTYTFILTAYNSNFGIYGANYTGVIDNVSVRLAEEDRSVNANGLQVFGTVTKTAVATGAELVGYSGFTSSNYLQQPNNSDFEFGTGNWSMTGWISQNGTASTQHPIQLGLTSGSSSEISILRQTSSSAMLLGFRVRGDSGSYMATPAGGLMIDNVWTHFVLTKKGNLLMWYINGKLIHSVASSNVGNIGFSSSDILRIGHGASTVTADVMKLALLRISATAPSEEQIKKIYNDEKHLFAPNAKATLYGSSDAVTALAYDDDTELLHVGTSAGRSVFQGLNRVDNTTDAVGAAISASNGFIVEE